MPPYRDPAFPYVEPHIVMVAVRCPWCGARGVAEAATVADCAACGARFATDAATVSAEPAPEPGPRPPLRWPYAVLAGVLMVAMFTADCSRYGFDGAAVSAGLYIASLVALGWRNARW